MWIISKAKPGTKTGMKLLKVSGLRLKSEAKDRYRDGREQQFLKFLVSGLLYTFRNY